MKTALLTICLCLASRLTVQLAPVLSDPDSDSSAPVTAESLKHSSPWEKSVNRTNVTDI
jgi:hypothetical protein